MVILGLFEEDLFLHKSVLDLSCASQSNRYKKKEQNFYCFDKIMVCVSIIVMWEK